jgi:hypothetical protein
LRETCTVTNNAVDINIESCGTINFSNNTISTSVSFNLNQAVNKLTSSDTVNTIIQNLKNDNTLKDESLLSAANINKNTIFNNLENTLTRNFNTITEEKLVTTINNFIKVSLQTTCTGSMSNGNIIFVNNDIGMTSNNVAQSLISQGDIIKSIDSTSTEIANKSTTSVSNAIATVMNSITSFFQSTLGLVIGIMLIGFVIFLVVFFTISKEIRKTLFGWIPNPFSKKKK